MVTSEVSQVSYAELKTKKARIAFIKEKVGSQAQWATRALVRIFEHQTSSEQAAGHTHELNGVGFSGCDSEILTSLASQFLKRGTLSAKQMAIVFKKMPKYARQLERLTQVVEK